MMKNTKSQQKSTLGQCGSKPFQTLVNRDQNTSKRNSNAIKVGQNSGDIIDDIIGSIVGSTGQDAGPQVELRADVINDVMMTGQTRAQQGTRVRVERGRIVRVKTH